MIIIDIRIVEEKRIHAEKKAAEAARQLSRLRQERAREFVREIREQMSELNFMDNRLEMRFTDTDITVRTEEMKLNSTLPSTRVSP